MEIADIQPDHRLRARNLTNGQTLASELRLALDPWRRLRGLLGSAPLTLGQGMLLHPCNSIHTFFMRYAIDAIFIDVSRRVVALVEHLKPWRASRIVRGAIATLELQAGGIAETNTKTGQLVGFELIEDNGHIIKPL